MVFSWVGALACAAGGQLAVNAAVTWAATSLSTGCRVVRVHEINLCSVFLCKCIVCAHGFGTGLVHVFVCAVFG
jgi:hypothetical protein